MTKLLKILIVSISTLMLTAAVVYAVDPADIGATINGKSICTLTVVAGDSFTESDTLHTIAASIPIGAIQLELTDSEAVPTSDVSFLNVKIVSPPTRYGAANEYQLILGSFSWTGSLDGDINAYFGPEVPITDADSPLLYYSGSTGNILHGIFDANLRLDANTGKRIYGGENEILTVQYTLSDN